MDYSLPVAKRTRLQEALVYRRLYEEKKRSASTSGSAGEDIGDGVVFLGEAGVSDFKPEFDVESGRENGGRENSWREKNGGEISEEDEEKGECEGGDEDVTDTITISISDGSEASECETEEEEEEEEEDDSDYCLFSPALDRQGKGKGEGKGKGKGKGEGKGKGKGKGEGKGEGIGKQASKLGKRKAEFGTFSHPFCIDEEEEGGEEEVEEEEGGKGEGGEEEGGEEEGGKGEGGEEERGKGEGGEEEGRKGDGGEEEGRKGDGGEEDRGKGEGEESSSSSSEEDEDEEGRASSSGRAESSRSSGGKDKGNLGAKPSKGKGIRALKNCDAFKILLDSIWEKDSGLLEELVSPGDSNPNEETMPELRLLFKWPPEESIPVEKSPHEIEMEQLFAQFDFSLRSAEIGSKESGLVGEENFVSAEDEIDQAVLCHQGNHQLVLNEQIGLVCRFCSFVQLEIKYILPTFNKNPWGQSEKRNAGNMDCNSIFDELQFHNPGSGLQSGSDHGVFPEGTVWDLIPGIKNTMYKHQCEGFEFIWNNVAGSIRLDELKKPSCSGGGSGCIISHAPGTGKTRLTIVFLQAYMELYPKCRPVIIAPRSMLLTWEEEFKKWNFDIPFHNLNKLEYSGQENITAMNFLRKVRHQGQSARSIRLVKLYSWKNDRSILGISYTLFEKLAGERVLVDRENKTIKVQDCTEGEDVRNILHKLPGLLVLDEGHTPRNEQSLIWKALSKIDTERRIILSGTPFQNNFKELRNTLCLVRPMFDDRITVEHDGGIHGKRGRKSNAARGTWDLLNSKTDKFSDDNIEELRAMIEPFVHIHKGTILQENLPGLKESVVFLQPSELQKRLLESVAEKKSILELGHLVSLISVHPSSLLSSNERKQVFDQTQLEKLKLDLDVGVKAKFLMEFIRLSEALNEKVLVFSQYIDPLTYLMDQLKYHFHWIVGKEVLYMYGQHDVKQRQSSINIFNDPASEVRVLLASTKACSEGISLVGASRVILLDVVWNPSVERQAISRAYRLGQTKLVYIYHLLTSGTMEEEKYCRQVKKDQLSELVFSSKGKNSGEKKISSIVSEDKILEEMVQHTKLKDMFDKIINQPKESDLVDTFGLVDL